MRICSKIGHQTWATFTVGQHFGKIIQRPEDQRFYQKPGRATLRPKDLCVVRIRVHWVLIRT